MITVDVFIVLSGIYPYSVWVQHVYTGTQGGGIDQLVYFSHNYFCVVFTHSLTSLI